MTLPDRVVFDAEPLVAHADGEPGSARVAEYLEAVGTDEIDGTVSRVTLVEVRYVLARKYDRATADEYLQWLWDVGVAVVEVEEVWLRASEYVLEVNPALGDAFALATAEASGGTLLVGGDEEYDDVPDVRIARFRDRGV